VSVFDLSSVRVFASVYQREWHCMAVCWCSVKIYSLTHSM